MEYDRSQATLEHIDFLLSSFTDNGKSLRGFETNPQELVISILTAGLLANSKLNVNPDDAIKSAFSIHAKIQEHVGRFQQMQFAEKIENCFTERPPEIEHD
tara:strand:+ start:844 stop:1146 length:303 start_codon:yes stop_codon:yes gene_type:complete